MTLTLLKIRSKKYIIRELLKLIRKGEQIAEGYRDKRVSVLKDEVDNWQSEINTFYELYTDNSKFNMPLGIISIPRRTFEGRVSASQRYQQRIFELNRLYEKIKESMNELRDIKTKIEGNEYETVFIRSKHKHCISRTYKKFKFYIFSIFAPVVIYGIIVKYGILNIKFDFSDILVIISIILAIISIRLTIHYRNKKD